ncbi:MAG: ATP-binding cassette domain-containing protein, partial [Thermoproteota archaeon]
AAVLMTEIALEEVTYAIEERPILDRVTLRVGAGESVAIIGPSGAGKTTILRLILGFARPTSGAVWVRGERVDTRSESEMQQVRRQAWSKPNPRLKD